MEVEDGDDSKDTSILVQTSLPMWKMLYNPLTTLLKDLDNAVDDLENLLSAFLSFENSFNDIFVPRNNSNLNGDNYEEVENKYFSFTLWFQGNLFYLLTFSHLKKIHSLAVKSQVKILTLVTSHPHLYKQLVSEYLELLKTIQSKKTNLNFETYQLHHFLRTVIELEDITLSPNFGRLTSDNENDVIVSIMQIMDFILRREINDSLITNKFVFESWNVLIDILNTNLFGQTQIYCMNSLNLILKINCVLEDTLLDSYFITFISTIKNLILANNFGLTDLEILSTTLQDTLDIFKLTKHDMNVLLNILHLCKLIKSNFDQNQSLIEACEVLTRKILIEHPFIVDGDCEFIENDYSRLAVQVRNVLKDATPHESQVNCELHSAVIDELIENINLNNTIPSLETIEQILLIIIESSFESEKSLKLNLYQIPTFFGEQLLIKIIPKFIQIIEFSDQNDVLFYSLGRIFYYLILLTNLTVKKQILTSNMQFMFGFLCHRFIKQISWKHYDNKINTILHNIHSGENMNSDLVKIYILTCIHFTRSEYKAGLSRVLKQLLSLNDHEKILVLKHIPYLIASGAVPLQSMLADWLIPVLNSNNQSLFHELSQILPKVICIAGNQYLLINYYDERKTDLKVAYDIICAHCDAKMDTNNGQSYWFKNQLYYMEKRVFAQNSATTLDKKSAEKIFLPFLKIISVSNTEIKMNALHVLTALSFHLPRLITLNVAQKWVTLLTNTESWIRKVACEKFPKLIHNIQNADSLEAESKEKIIEECINGLIKSSQMSLQNSDKEFQNVIIDCVMKFGCLKNVKNSTLISLKLLIHFALNIRSVVQEFACIYIEDLAHAVNLTNNQLYINYKKDICKTIVELSVFNYVLQKICFSSSLHKLARTFDFINLNDFIVQEGRYLLPYLIPWMVKLPYLKALLDSISDMTLLPSSELLVNQFGNIYPHIYLNESNEMYEKCIKCLKVITKTDDSVLKRKHFRVIFNELLLYFHKNQSRVLSGLKILFQDEIDGQNDAQIINAIQSRFLGLLVYFDSKLNSKRVAISDKRNALQSLPEIIKLMGARNITPLRFKVMATLHSTLHIGLDEFNKLSCYVWNAFVKNCDIDAIGPLLSTIFTSLLPLHEQFPDVINDIFSYLVIHHEKDLLEYLPDLFFVTESNVNNNIKSIIKNALKSYSQMNFRDQLQFYLKYLQHDNIEVRVYGLNFTTQLLEKNRELLNELILGYNGLDPIVVELIDLLVKGFREKNKNYYLACSKCIGELGAIEPSHLPKRYAKQNETFTFTINEDNFAFKALNELIRAFQSEKYSQNMDCFALAIQEILKAYNVSPDSGSNSKSIWNNFPENQQQIMQPLLTSRYKIAFQAEKPTCHPIFQSSSTKNFIDWIHGWIAKLIPLIKTDSCRYLFDCCQPSLRKDMQVLMFFLPYILLHSILEADAADKKEIYEEMLTVLVAYKSKNGNTNKRLQFKPLKSDLLRYMPSLPTNDEITLAQAAKVIYVLLDFLLRWLREWEQQHCPGKKPDNDQQYVKLSSFVKKFCKLSVAQSNYNHEEFPRALMYLEDYVNANPEDLKNQLGFFTRIYVQLDDPDSVAGIRSIQQQEPLLEDMILSHEISGQLQDAAACYERLAQEVRLHPQTLQGLIRCYLDLDNPYTAHRIIEGLDYKTSEFSTNLYECEVETLWRLHDYDKLESVLNNSDIQKLSSWGVNLGNILLNFHQGKQEEFWKEIIESRCLLVQPLSVSSREEGGYEYGYPQVMKLHLLNELEKVQNLVNQILKTSNDAKACGLMVDNLILEFDQRDKLVQSSVRVLEPIYCLRRTALQQSQELLKVYPENIRNIFDKHIGNYWVKSAQVARITGMYQQAYINLLNAEKYKPTGLFIEKAKLHWARGEQEIAFNILKRGLESTALNDMRKIVAEAKLLVAVYNEETANLDVEANIAKYKEAIDSNKECEMSMVYLARYYDKALASMPGDKDIGLGGDMQLHMIHNFGKSLQFGKEFLYQSMPRMLSIWLDYGSRQYENKDKETHEIKSLNVLKMTKLISTYLDRLPTYMFLSAFSQIVSRICHPQKQVYQQLKSIIVKLIQTYPQQTLWMIMSVYKSSYSVRVKRCQEILQDDRLRAVPGLVTLIHDFNRFAEKLIDLCNKPINNGVSVTSVSTLIKSLPRLITSSEFSQIMVPVEQYLKMILPMNNELLAEHNPYPKKLVYVIGIDETVTVMPSLQRPRRITLLGSDGKKYMHMLKPKDDLRKDFRLMEFNGVVNQFLYQESESRQRRLHIRTYAVVPLNEECGIIEWVPDLIPFRAIILKLHKQKNSYVSAKDLRAMMCNIRDSLQKKRQVYLEQLLTRHPLVFHEWFRQTFSDPHAWYQARTSYIRTTATISMVGYILGLGDRHGENILFDSTNGDTVHVDFNCLFNRGEALEWPERVPFRLTPNMVKAMGPLGIEGTFRRSCEVTLRVLRSQKDTLMSILKPFVYDPLVSWPKNPYGTSVDANAERTNEQARDHVRNIESRLQGIKGGGKLPIRLSVEGHVNSLILDATSIDNLCQMYIGWGSYL